MEHVEHVLIMRNHKKEKEIYKFVETMLVKQQVKIAKRSISMELVLLAQNIPCLKWILNLENARQTSVNQSKELTQMDHVLSVVIINMQIRVKVKMEENAHRTNAYTIRSLTLKVNVRVVLQDKKQIKQGEIAGYSCMVVVSINALLKILILKRNTHVKIAVRRLSYLEARGSQVTEMVLTAKNFQKISKN